MRLITFSLGLSEAHHGPNPGCRDSRGGDHSEDHQLRPCLPGQVANHTPPVVAAGGKGGGWSLSDGVYEQAKLAGSPRVYWFTYSTNQTAMQLYDKVAEKTGIVVYRKVF